MSLRLLNNSAQLSKNKKHSAFFLKNHQFLSWCINWCFKRLLVTQRKIAIMLSEQRSTTKQKLSKRESQLFNFISLQPD